MSTIGLEKNIYDVTSFLGRPGCFPVKGGKNRETVISKNVVSNLQSAAKLAAANNVSKDHLTNIKNRAKIQTVALLVFGIALIAFAATTVSLPILTGILVILGVGIAIFSRIPARVLPEIEQNLVNVNNKKVKIEALKRAEDRDIKKNKIRLNKPNRLLAQRIIDHHVLKKEQEKFLYARMLVDQNNLQKKRWII